MNVGANQPQVSLALLQARYLLSKAPYVSLSGSNPGANV
jgi:hypothetical protein